MLWRRRLQPIAQPLFRLYARTTRGMTLGVRGAVVNEAGEVLLVEHTYVHGWHLPGGGVEVGETLQVSLARELLEEGGITPLGPVALHGVFFNARVSRRDHVAVYVLRDFRQQGVPHNPREIIGHGFFARDALPADTTRGTRARIAEVFDGVPITEQW